MHAIKGETIWITGASTGIGRELALRLAAAGNCILASARNEQILNDLAQDNPNIIAVPLDVCQNDQIEQQRAQLAQHCHQLDRIILNAGNCEYLDLDAPDWEMMRRIMEVNYFGSINSLAMAMPLLADNAHIIGMGSLATAAPFPRAEAYGSSKAALQYFYDSLRVDLADKFDVTVVNPGFVKTPLTDKNDFDMPFIIGADEAAKRTIDRLATRPRQIDFPARLKWLLKLLSASSTVWYKLIAPNLKRDAVEQHSAKLSDLK